ncbi:MAG TPA: hypothetical protein PKJ13_01725 [bacterium]|nr:hypothetical protein [bacterium]HOC23995.1 hypothetical protein [bacterium]HOH07310.1 hypothetical protein [bacterium]HOY43766.1 hypothetical protein [bacterium]HPG83081.1 hypothetical protein [bacterium]
MSSSKMYSIWFFVGVMLTILGLIIVSMGVYYIFSPETHTRLASLNPSLWWGAIMLTAGLLFLIPSWIEHRKG